MKIIIATIKSWNIDYAYALQKRMKKEHEILVFTKKEELNVEEIEKFAPDIIFFPHWSYMISNEITEKWTCVVFHMTDLPYGRGGSPLQNLIVRGHKETMISAIKVTEKLDGGPIYMKKPLCLEGSAQEIFIRSAKVVFEEMIPLFLKGIPKAEEQEGEPVVFKRRKPEEGKITEEMSLEKIYDYIRMLDAEGYPRAYLEYGNYRLEFEQASMSEDGNSIEAKAVFHKE